jgi:hypothetical protein
MTRLVFSRKCFHWVSAKIKSLSWCGRFGVRARACHGFYLDLTLPVKESSNDYVLNIVIRDFFGCDGLEDDKRGGTATNG